MPLPTTSEGGAHTHLFLNFVNPQQQQHSRSATPKSGVMAFGEGHGGQGDSGSVVISPSSGAMVSPAAVVAAGAGYSAAFFGRKHHEARGRSRARR